MANDTKPIFLLSTPRAGSTLLQRILASHSKISTTPEPYLLLPLVYSLKVNGIVAHYHQPYVAKGISDFCESLPQTIQTYHAHIREFVLSLYSQAACGAPFFLDKTPFYDLISNDILDLFPDAKVIVLWRNPLAAIASAVELWGGEQKWQLFLVSETMTQGLVNLVDTTLKYSSRICILQFESLISNPESEIKRITDYLGLNYEPNMIASFTKINLEGKMGDPIGTKKYNTISREPMEKWKKTMAGPLRKAWARRYLKWLGRKRIEQMGYDIETLLCDLDAIPTKYTNLPSDCYEMLRDTLKIKAKQVFLNRINRWL